MDAIEDGSTSDKRTASSTTSTADDKRIRSLTSDLGSMSLTCPIYLEQIERWYGFDGGVVVMSLFTHPDSGAWAIVLLKDSGRLAVQHLDFAHDAICAVGKRHVLEGSARVTDRITHAEAVASGFGENAIGAAKLSMCMDLYYHARSQRVVGIDTGGVWQVWSLQDGSCLTEGTFKHTVDDVEYNVRVNAACLTDDWLVAVTCLDDATNATTVFAVSLDEPDTVMIPLVWGVSGVHHLVNDKADDALIRMATDSGPFLLDTRWPHSMWVPIPPSTLFPLLEIDKEDMKFTVGRYMSRFKKCAQDQAYRTLLETGVWNDDSTELPREELINDLRLSTSLQKQTYPVTAISKCNHIVPISEVELIVVCDDGYYWLNLADGTMVPDSSGGIVSGTSIDGAFVFCTGDRSVTMVQCPWGKRTRSTSDFSQRMICRTQDPSVLSVTKFNDGEADARNLVCSVSRKMVFVHAFDDGVYAFRASYDYEKARVVGFAGL